MTLQENYGTVMYQAWPEVSDLCWLCERETGGCYVVWGLSTGELAHVCDACVSDGDREDEPEEALGG